MDLSSLRLLFRAIRGRRDRWAVLCIGLTVASCGGDITSNEGGATLAVVLGQAAGDLLAATAPPDSFEVTIAGPVNQRRSGVPGQSIQFSAVPVGTYTVRVEAYSGSVLVWDGEDVVSVSADATEVATIVPVPREHLPEVTITEPASGATVASDAIRFSGTATDREDGVLTASIEWSSSEDGPLGTGGSVTVSLSLGAHVISATVQDGAGQSVSATISLTAIPGSGDQPPVVTITEPGQDTTVTSGDAVTLSAMASDPEDGDLSGSIEWSSDLDGSLGTGASVSAMLSDGTHTITASVQDLAAQSATDEVMVTVAASGSPSIVITEPSQDTTVTSGDAVTLSATASDPEDGDLSASIQWSSDLDGSLGTGASVSAMLSDGTHTITASVQDLAAQSATDEVTVTVAGSGFPSIVITEPSQDTTVTSGDAVTLSGTASDPEDGDLSSSIQWSSDLDGSLGTGASVSAMLSDGTHTITASVQDLGGNQAQLTVTIVVNVPPSADAGGPYSGAVNTAIAFDGSGSTDPDGSIVSYAWDFGDGGTAVNAGPAASHTYTSTGTFTVTLTVTDDDGATASSTTSANVSDSAVLQPHEFCSDYPSSAIATFADPDLEGAVRFSLGVGPQDDLTCGLLATLNSLSARNAGVGSLTGAQNLSGLTSADLTNNLSIADLGPLSGLTGLETLQLANNAISDLTPLSGLTALETLVLESNDIVDISPLSGLTALTELRIPDNQITNVTALSGLTNLTTLVAWRNTIADISSLSGLTNLTLLNLGTNQISDISALSGMTLLTTLIIDTNQISDISALSGLTALEDLRLYSNQITNISSLTGLTALTSLRLDGNTGLSNIQPLLDNAGLGAGDAVDLRSTAVSCVDVAQLEAKGVTVTSDCE